MTVLSVPKRSQTASREKKGDFEFLRNFPLIMTEAPQLPICLFTWAAKQKSRSVGFNKRTQKDQELSGDHKEMTFASAASALRTRPNRQDNPGICKNLLVSPGIGLPTSPGIPLGGVARQPGLSAPNDTGTEKVRLGATEVGRDCRSLTSWSCASRCRMVAKWPSTTVILCGKQRAGF